MLQTDIGISNESISKLRTKTSDLSIPSEHRRSGSLINLNSIHTNRRFSIYNFNCNKTKNHQIKTTTTITTANHHRRHSERISIHRKAPSITIDQYITYNYDETKPKPLFNYNSMAHSALNLTHSTIHTATTTASENSNFIDQNKLLKPITTNFHRK